MIGLTSLLRRLGLLFLAFFLLILISVAATFWGIDIQKQDTLVVNIARYQTMLINQMSEQASEFVFARGNWDALALQQTTDAIDQSLSTLINGRPVPSVIDQTMGLPPARDPQLLAQLNRINQMWAGLHSSIYALLHPTPGIAETAIAGERSTALREIRNTSPALIRESDSLVQMATVNAENDLARLRWIQIMFLGSALILLGVSAMVIQRSMIRPLKVLEAAATRLGQGDLDTPLSIDGPQEMRILASAFENMRLQMRASHIKLLRWADDLKELVNQRTREAEALYQISADITSHLEIHQVLQLVTDEARQLLGGEVSLLCLLDENKQFLSLQGISGPKEAVLGPSVPVTKPLSNRVLEGQPLADSTDGCNYTCEMFGTSYQNSHLAASLRISGHVIGALCVGSSHPDAFSPEASKLLAKLASSAAIALENARLYTQAEKMAVLEERQRIAADMHDGLAQTISYLSLMAGEASDQMEAGDSDHALNTLQGVLDGLDHANSDLRKAIASLREMPLLPRSLQERLADLVKDFCGKSNVNVEWNAGSPSPLMLPQTQIDQIEHIALEALSNAKRYARADKIHISLQQVGSEAVLVIEDDGQGFDPNLTRSDESQHFGLSIMRSRAARIGGQLDIQSAPGQGTRVLLIWPVKTEILNIEVNDA